MSHPFAQLDKEGYRRDGQHPRGGWLLSPKRALRTVSANRKL